jgi:hypothetical protein
MRRWSLTCNSYYSDLSSVGQEIGRYRNVSAGGGLSRSIGSRNLFFTARFDVRRYLAGSSFRRTATEGSVGFAYSPGDLPLRLW